MLSLPLTFFTVAFVGGLLGFGGFRGTVAEVGQIVFVFFSILWLVSIINRRKITEYLQRKNQNKR